VQPDYACFGRKDFQQLILIEQMVRDLAIPIEIIPVDIVRAESGLALSSRNSNLNDEELLLAPTLSKVMQQLGHDIKQNILNADDLIENATNTLNKVGFVTDEIHIVDTQTLLPLTKKSEEAAILMAAFLRGTRLIDNQVTRLI
jgi:pantoate--beta-alanine ligase